MPWIYHQISGRLLLDGELIATGFSGWGAARNDPRAEMLPLCGPIPRGKWLLSERFDSEVHGAVCFRLTPCVETETYGRSAFLVRGEAPGGAEWQHGSIVLPRSARLAIAASGGARELEVI